MVINALFSWSRPLHRRKKTRFIFLFYKFCSFWFQRIFYVSFLQIKYFRTFLFLNSINAGLVYSCFKGLDLVRWFEELMPIINSSCRSDSDRPFLNNWHVWFNPTWAQPEERAALHRMSLCLAACPGDAANSSKKGCTRQIQHQLSEDLEVAWFFEQKESE